MDKNRIKYLLDQYITNSLTEMEKEELDTWYMKFDSQVEDAHLASLREEDAHLAAKMFGRISERINKRTYLNFPYRWAATIAFLLVSALVLMSYRTAVYQQLVSMSTYAVTVPKGKMIVVNLPDDSQAWVRSGSTISYNRFFMGDQRTVRLNGEAYFQVEKNPDKPFVVQSGDWETSVLGTSFNVKALVELGVYEVMVRTGKVRVADSDHVLATLLPGERVSEYDGSVVVDQVNVSQYLQWRAGTLVFDNSSMEEIAWYLENRFDVRIELANDGLEKFPFSGNFSGLALRDILSILQEVHPFEITKMSNDHIVIREINTIE